MPLDDRIRRRLKLRDLDILHAVMQAGTMGKAAERLHMSQSAVSKSIADLERTLGVHLLDRSRRGIEPTRYGRALEKCGVTVFDELRQGLRLIDFLADPATGELRVGTTPALATGIVATVVERLSRAYPRVAFHITEADTTILYRDLRERKFDLVMTRMPAPIAEVDMQATVLFSDPLVVAAGTQNPWTKRRKLELADLINEPWTMSPADSFIGSLVAEAFRAKGVGIPNSTVVASSIALRHRLVAVGRFLTIVPRFVLNGPAADQSLRALPIELPTTRRPVGIVTLTNRTTSPAAGLFLDCAREVVKPLSKGG